MISKKFRMLEDRVLGGITWAKKGDIVHDFLGYDYGLANDDERHFKEEHISVSNKPFTGKTKDQAPSFTVPKRIIEEIKDDTHS